MYRSTWGLIKLRGSEWAMCTSAVFPLSHGISPFPPVPSQPFGPQAASKRHFPCEELRPACGTALCVQLCSSAVLTALGPWFRVVQAFSCSVSIAKPWPPPVAKSRLFPCRAAAPTAGCPGKGRASGGTQPSPEAQIALSWSQRLPWVTGTFLWVFGNPFPAGGGMGGVGMP